MAKKAKAGVQNVPEGDQPVPETPKSDSQDAAAEEETVDDTPEEGHDIDADDGAEFHSPSDFDGVDPESVDRFHEETTKSRKLRKAIARATHANEEQAAVHDELSQHFEAVRQTLLSTADGKHPRQLRWALKALDAAHVAAKNHVDRNVGAD